MREEPHPAPPHFPFQKSASSDPQDRSPSRCCGKDSAHGGRDLHGGAAAEVAPQPGCSLLGTTIPLQGQVPHSVLHLPSAASSQLLPWKLLKAGWEPSEVENPPSLEMCGSPRDSFEQLLQHQGEPHLSWSLEKRPPELPLHPALACHRIWHLTGVQRAVIPCGVMGRASTTSSIPKLPGTPLHIQGTGQFMDPGASCCTRPWQGGRAEQHLLSAVKQTCSEAANLDFPPATSQPHVALSPCLSGRAGPELKVVPARLSSGCSIKAA